MDRQVQDWRGKGESTLTYVANNPPLIRIWDPVHFDPGIPPIQNIKKYNFVSFVATKKVGQLIFFPLLSVAVFGFGNRDR